MDSQQKELEFHRFPLSLRFGRLHPRPSDVAIVGGGENGEGERLADRDCGREGEENCLRSGREGGSRKETRNNLPEGGTDTLLGKGEFTQLLL